MSIFPLFNIAVPSASISSPSAQRKFGAENVAGPVSDGPATTSVGAFVTPQTLVTFTGATGVIASLYACLAALIPIHASVAIYVIALLSVIVGALIYGINMIDPNAPRLDTKQRVTSIVIASLNTAILFNASRAIIHL